MGIPVREEQDWARKYPVPNSNTEDILLSLWNYPVARTDLTPEHRAALKKFLGGDFMHLTLAGTTDTMLFVRGHASDSGEADANIALSRDRAQKVARFLISEGFPSSQIRVEWAGATEPEDTGKSGYAASRNRRVDVVRFVPPEPEIRPPTDIEDPGEGPVPDPTPAFKIPKSLVPSSASVEIPINIELPKYVTPNLVISGKIEGSLKVKADDKGGGWGGSMVVKDGKLTPKVVIEVNKHVNAKIGIEGGKDGGPPVLKLGFENKAIPLKPEFGVQASVLFVYMNFTLLEIPLPDIQLGEVKISMVFTGKAKLEFGPGPALATRLAPVVAGAGEAVGGAVVASGAVAVAAVVTVAVIGGTIYAIEDAKQGGIEYAKLQARRSGIASRIALEIIGTAGEGSFGEQRMRWYHTVDGMGGSFDRGVGAVNAVLKSTDRDAKAAAWKAKFAADGNQDFTTLHKRVIVEVGGDSNDPAAGTPVDSL
jgi:OmpA family protein